MGGCELEFGGGVVCAGGAGVAVGDPAGDWPPTPATTMHNNTTKMLDL